MRFSLDDDDAAREARGWNRKNILLGVAFAVVLVVGFVGGVLVGSRGNIGTVANNIPFIGNGLSATPDQSANFTDFWEVWNALNQDYVITHASSTLPTTQEKMWGAIEGLTAAYGDPYTVFFPPQQAQDFQDDITGSFGGVGAEIGVDKNNVLSVIAPLQGSPAQKAGLKAGDEITAINGQSTDGMSPDDAVNVIRGPEGTTVTFTILRDGTQMTIKVTRAIIQVPEIEYGLNRTTGVYDIALYEFTANSASLFDTAFNAFKASGSKMLVIDLRGNPGGYLSAAVDIASHFLPAGQLIVTEDYEGKQQNITHTSTGTDDVPPGTKVVVLIDQGSASASEILAGALKDQHVATLIGTRSFGKGSVQELLPIDGGDLKVTVARWLTPSGLSIMGNGITPDIDVEISSSTPAGTDPQMARAVQFLTTGK